MTPMHLSFELVGGHLALGLNEPDEKLCECGGALVDSQAKGFHIELEEDARSALVVLDLSCVMSDAILIGVQGRASWGNESRRYDMQEILVRDES